MVAMVGTRQKRIFFTAAVVVDIFSNMFVKCSAAQVAILVARKNVFAVMGVVNVVGTSQLIMIGMIRVLKDLHQLFLRVSEIAELR